MCQEGQPTRHTSKQICHGGKDADAVHNPGERDGGGGPVTKDTIQASRKAVYLPDADIIVSGHTHDRWIFPITRTRLKDNGEQILRDQVHLKIGTYKDEFTHGGGWAVEKGMPPKSMGGVWLSMRLERINQSYDVVRITAELT